MSDAPGTLSPSAATTARTIRAPRHPVVAAFFALIVTAFDGMLLGIGLGGIHPLLDHPWARALLIIWAIAGVSLAVLHPIKVQDVIAQERDPSWRLLLLFLLPLLIPPVAAYADRQHWLPLPGGDTLRWTGVGLVAAGLALRITSMATLGQRFAPIPAVQRDHAIEQRGVYRWIRHPGYLGAWMAALGAMLAFANNLALPMLVLFAALLAQRARREEALLEQHLGDGWRAYRARTGAFLPRFGG